jgi:uncharacterized cupin superfamily protein
MADDLLDLTSTFIHLGLGSTAIPLRDFSWSPRYLKNYIRTYISDRDERRLVGIVPTERSWTHWECHTGGDEVVIQLSGRCDIIQDLAGELRVVTMVAGQALINPRGVWHTSDVHEPGQSLFIAAGRTTRYRPRERPTGTPDAPAASDLTSGG